MKDLIHHRMNWMTDILNKWQKENGLPSQCAYEQQFDIDLEPNDDPPQITRLKRYQLSWLERFCYTWDRVAEDLEPLARGYMAEDKPVRIAKEEN